ncbi:MAG: GldG family protein [Acidobacteria bacterium]|nr:GldG family protein [Acidobacteriota bacterium]
MRKLLQNLNTIGLLLVAAAVLWNFVTNIWGVWNIALAIAGGICIITGLAFNYRQILASLGKRSTKYAGNYVISLILVVAIVSGLNFVGQKHSKRFDLTAEGQFTLAPQTAKVLKGLDRDVDIKAFFSGGEYGPLKQLLTEYRTLSPRIRYEFIDPDRQPDIARQYEVEVYGAFQNPLTGSQLKFGTVVISAGDRSEKIEKRSEEVMEQDLTNAIIKTLRTETPKIYFVRGHGEKDPEDTGQRGYSDAQKAMQDQGYVVESVNLVEAGGVPEDAKALILAGPEKEPFAQEFDFINEFLDKGGSVLVLADPDAYPSLAEFTRKWGVQLDDNVVLDVSGVGQLMGTGPSIPLVTGYENHPITDRFDAMTFFPLTRSVQPLDSPPEGISVDTLFKSNPQSWGETDLDLQKDRPEVEYTPGRDQEGPLSLAVAVTKEIKPATDETPALNARMVVAGTSNFPINAYFSAQGNGNLFLNMISWLAQDDDLISIRPKDPEDRRIVLSQSQLSLIRLLVVFLFPGVALVAGIAVVLNRRRR